MVEVQMDNTMCKKKVDFYQLSLIRTVKTKKTHEFNQFIKETNLDTRKVEGVAKHEFETKFINLEIPTHEETTHNAKNI